MSALVKGRYRELEVVGRGGQGTVVHALDIVHERHVALKVRALPSESERADVLEEARILLSVRPHPNLPLLREDFMVGDRYYLVMDWIEGRSLRQVLDEHEGGGLPFEQVLGYLSQVAEALDHLHDHDPPVVHQDVKPANLVLTTSGRVMLVDFGIARHREVAGSAPRGTFPYAAPEVVLGRPSPASDIFSLAVTAYTLLTGSPPRPEVLPRLGGAFDEGVFRALRRGLATDPGHRPASATALVEAMRAAARSTTGNRRNVVMAVVAGAVLVAGLVFILSRDGALPDGPGDARASTTSGPSSSASPRDVFRDDFSNPSTGWPHNNKDYFYDGEGGYRIRIDTDFNRLAAGPRHQGDPILAALSSPGANVGVEVDVAVVSGTRGGMGLYCRLQPGRADRYRAVVFPNGQWNISRDSKGTEPLVSGETTLQQSGDGYHIKLVCSGDGRPTMLMLEVGGRRIGEWTDPDGLQGGEVGVQAVTATAPFAEVKFDNFSAARLP